MKKITVMVLGIALMSSCGNTESGVFNGAYFGSILGSAIGGISDGPRGSDWGTIIGTAGGAVVGGVIGSASEKARKQKIEKYHERVRSEERGVRSEELGVRSEDGAYVDLQNGGDDRIVLEGMSAPEWKMPASEGLSTGNQTISMANLRDADDHRTALEISRVTYISDSGDGILRPGASGRIVFELRNRSRHTVRDVRPIVAETTGNRYVTVSPGIQVESIAPGSGIKYTAMVMGGKRLKAGELLFSISAVYGSNRSTEAQELRVEARK